VGIDQVLWNPIFGTMFFGYLGLAEGQDLNGIKSRIEKDLWTSVKGSWTVWPIAHAINFRFIPNSQRLLYINSVQVRCVARGHAGMRALIRKPSLEMDGWMGRLRGMARQIHAV
jgi:hypothetical protein